MIRNMSLNLSVEEQPSVDIYIFAAIALGFIGFFGFFLNLLVIITVVKNANILWTPNNVVLVNMVVSIFYLYNEWLNNFINFLKI